MLVVMLTMANRLPLPAQSLSVIHAFNPLSGSGTNADGDQPQAALLVASNLVFGVTPAGGTNDSGVVFSVGTTGSNFTVLHSFAALVNNTNADGAYPSGPLVLASNVLFGTTSQGGTNGNGTIFALATNGAAFRVLHAFGTYRTNQAGIYTNADGANPAGGLVLAGNLLYGTTEYGGTNGLGVVFSLLTNGTTITTLHGFSAVSPYSPQTNADGAVPVSGLVLAGGRLFGAAQSGGAHGWGAVYSVATNGTGFDLLHSFTYGDGAAPVCALVLGDNLLYGTTQYGGANGSGAVFSVTTNGSAFYLICSFSASAGDAALGVITNTEGFAPIAGLALAGDTLYGTTYSGGPVGSGTIFALNTNGTAPTVLHAFSHLSNGTNAEGADPRSQVVFAGHTTLYGCTRLGDTNGSGTLFSLVLSPNLTGITLARTNLILNAVNGVAGEACYVLTATNLTQPLTNWSRVATNLLSGGGSFTLTATNAVTPGAAQRFYRLEAQ